MPHVLPSWSTLIPLTPAASMARMSSTSQVSRKLAAVFRDDSASSLARRASRYCRALETTTSWAPDASAKKSASSWSVACVAMIHLGKSGPNQLRSVLHGYSVAHPTDQGGSRLLVP